MDIYWCEIVLYAYTRVAYLGGIWPAKDDMYTLIIGLLTINYQKWLNNVDRPDMSASQDRDKSVYL